MSPSSSRTMVRLPRGKTAYPVRQRPPKIEHRLRSGEAGATQGSQRRTHARGFRHDTELRGAHGFPRE